MFGELPPLRDFPTPLRPWALAGVRNNRLARVGWLGVVGQDGHEIPFQFIF